MENNKFLPIGTVVMLKEGKKRIMITGFVSTAIENNNQVIYDYSGCIYPEGLLSSNQVCLFNHDQIQEVFFKGFVDEEEIEFKKNLNELVSSLSKNDNNQEDILDEI